MSKLPVIEVEHPDGGTMWINESDYDAKKHTKVGAPKKAAAKTSKKKASDKSDD